MILDLPARQEADFDLDLPGKPAKPLEAAAALRYLENPAELGRWRRRGIGSALLCEVESVSAR
jgi:hypothetical protein